MKKTVLLSVAVTATLALAACGGEEAPAATSTPIAAATQAATAAAKASATATATAAASATPAAAAAATTQTVSMTALEDGEKYSFDPASLNLKTGEVVVKLANKAGNARPHTFAVRDAAGKELVRSERVASGANGEVKFALTEAGTYQFFCGLQGHEDKGQRGTMTVTKG